MWFGNIEDEKVQGTDIGMIAQQFLNEIPEHYEQVVLDQNIIMPNHLHVILIIEGVGVQYIEPLQKHAYQILH